MGLLIFLFMLVSSLSYVPALRCRNCAFVHYPIGQQTDCVNSSHPIQVCSDNITYCFAAAIDVYDALMNMQYHARMWSCDPTDSLCGANDACDILNSTFLESHEQMLSCKYGCCSEDLCDPMNMATPHHMSSSFAQLSTTATITKVQITDSASTHSMSTAESVSPTTVTSPQATATASTHSMPTTEPWIGHKQGNSCNRPLPLFQTTVCVIVLPMFFVVLR